MADEHFTLWWYRLLFVGFYLLIIVLSFTTRLADAPVLSGLLAVFACVLAVLHARGATVTLAQSGVVVRGLRSKRIPWTDLRGVRVGRGSSVLFRWRVPVFELRDGSVVRADEIRSLRSGSIVDRLVAAAQARIE